MQREATDLLGPYSTPGSQHIAGVGFGKLLQSSESRDFTPSQRSLAGETGAVGKRAAHLGGTRREVSRRSKLVVE